jgi:hypothetical protein
MNQAQCIATGSEFFSPIEGRYVHGDLIALGDAFIFNAVTNREGQTAWQYGHPGPGLLIAAAKDGAYFERRGVIVFTRDAASFNDALRQYVAPHYRLPEE